MSKKQEHLLINDKKLRALIAASPLTNQERDTLRCMADGLNRNTLVIRMGVIRLAEHLKLTRRQTQQRLRALEATGVIKLIKDPRGGRSETGKGYVNEWSLCLDQLVPDEKDVPQCAPKGAAGQPVERTEGASRAHQNAQDTDSSMSQKKNSSAAGPPASLAGGGPTDADEVRHYLNPYETDDVWKQKRVQNLRRQAAWDNRKNGTLDSSGG